MSARQRWLEYVLITTDTRWRSSRDAARLAGAPRLAVTISGTARTPPAGPSTSARTRPPFATVPSGPEASQPRDHRPQATAWRTRPTSFEALGCHREGPGD